MPHPASRSEWSGQTMDRAAWIDVMFEAGLECRFEPDAAADNAAMVDWHRAGQLSVGNVELAGVSVSPVAHCNAAPDDHLYLKVVQSGSLLIEQNRRLHRYDAGSMLVVDPAYGFKDRYAAATRVAILQMPRSALKDRGLRYSFSEPHAAYLASEDVQAVRGQVVQVARQSRAASEPLLERLGQQCLDLLDLVLDQPRASAQECANATILLRTKQVVLRRLADCDLSVGKIAAELNMSPSALTRALKARGWSPMRYAWSLRLERAADMLKQAKKNQLQAKEVAYRCGFADAAHFSRAFKAKYGMSPRAFA